MPPAQQGCSWNKPVQDVLGDMLHDFTLCRWLHTAPVTCRSLAATYLDAWSASSKVQVEPDCDVAKGMTSSVQFLQSNKLL